MMRSLARRYLTISGVVALSGVMTLFASDLASRTDKARASHIEKPTVVLVHGAFAESSSWDGVTRRLLADGYPVVAVANPLRGVASDARQVASVLDTLEGPVILVGHSYGGSVISAAAVGKRNVKALVYVAAFAPDLGESAFTLSAKFPGSTLGAALAPPVPLADGTHDLYIAQDKFAEQFAADLPWHDARVMAATQRPVADAALNEAATSAAWKDLPSWFFYGTADKNIPSATQAFMAERAHAKKVVAIRGASHVVMISHPDALARLIEESAR